MKKSIRYHRFATSLLIFTGGLHADIATVSLGTAADYVSLGKTAITTTAGSAIADDLGISLAALSDMTGFNATLDGAGQFATSSLVTGSIFSADMGGQTAANLTTAVSDMEAAYTDAATRSNPDFLNLDTGILNGTTQALTAGLYKWTSNVTITDSVTIDGEGDANAVWIFQIDNRLTLSSSAQVFLSGGANASNIFWQTAEGVTIGTDAQLMGTILTATDIALMTDATFSGHLLAQTAITMQSNTINAIPEVTTFAPVLGLCALSIVMIRRRLS